MILPVSTNLDKVKIETSKKVKENCKESQEIVCLGLLKKIPSVVVITDDGEYEESSESLQLVKDFDTNKIKVMVIDLFLPHLCFYALGCWIYGKT